MHVLQRRLLAALGLAMGLCGGTAKADNPTPWWCPVGYSRSIVFTITSTTYTCSAITSSAGVGTNANPDVTLSITTQVSGGATASNTIGIDEGVVATTTIGVNVGWSTTIATSVNFDFANGVNYTCYLGYRYIHLSGPVTATDTSGTSCFTACNSISHVHTGTWAASKCVGTCSGHTP